MPVGELTAALPVGQSTVSHHLAALAAVGFARTPVETHVEVRQRYDHRKLAVEDGVDPSDEEGPVDEDE